ncbi:MAG: phospholipase D-like domain-containing protein, partial [Burkholderiales bacterium]
IIDDRNTPKHTPPRQDFAVRVEGPVVADMHAAVRRLWTHIAWLQFRHGWRASRGMRLDKQPAGDQRAAFIVRDNFRHRGDIENAYLGAIASAQKEIVIACAYFFPGIRFRHALCEAAARGVRVVLLLQGRVEYVLLHYASRALYRQFLREGIEIHEYVRSFMHAKVAVIDGRWATVGSSNIDPISFLLAREANIVVEDPEFGKQLRTSLEFALHEGAREVRPERWRPSAVARATTWIAYGLVRALTDLTSYARGEER